MSCPRFCLPCCYCCAYCSPCAQRWLSEQKFSSRRKSYVEYGAQTPAVAVDSSEWPTKDQRVPISQVLADTPDVPYWYGLAETPPVTQQPRGLHSPARRLAEARRRQSQPALPGNRLAQNLPLSLPSSPHMGRRRVSHPMMRPESPSPGAMSPSFQAQLGPSPRGSPMHGAMAGRRRSVQMASLHQDFYSESEEGSSSAEEDERAEVFSHHDVTASDYETSATSEEEDADSFGSSASVPLLSHPTSHPKPKHSSTIPHIIVTEPFEIGPDPTLQFSLYYDFKRRTLIVHLQKAFNLPVREIDKDTSHTFVIIYLLPNRETDRETYESSVVHNTLNPNFDEMFQFPRLKQEVARKQTLVFRIYHQCGPKHNILIGGVLEPLEGVDFHGKTIRKRIVEDVEEHQQDTQGRLLVSLTYNPAVGTLDGTIFEANNLTKQDVFGLADPYVKVYLIYKGKRLGKWKTKVKKNTLVPVFNESFQFLVPGLNPKDLMLQIVVMDYDRFSRNDHVGIVDLGSDVSNDSGRNHWLEIIKNPREAISHWHPILPATKKGKKKKKSASTTALPICINPTQ